MTSPSAAAEPTARRRLAFFERYLTLWVALCMAAGLLFGKLIPAGVQHLRDLTESTQISDTVEHSHDVSPLRGSV